MGTNPEEPNEVEIYQLLASLFPEDNPEALRVLGREAIRQAPDCLNSGKVAPEEQPQQNAKRAMDEEVI
jgi:hypothetical protein